jgi:hypothetical protein
MRRLFFGCLGAVAIFFALFVSSAGAVDIIESQEPGGVAESPAAGFQAGTCTEDATAVEVEAGTGAFCSSETPELFFKQAAGHPGAAFTQINVRLDENGKLAGAPKTFLVDLPAGLSVNNQATPECELITNEEGKEVFRPFPECPEDTKVGEAILGVKLIEGFPPFPLTLPVYNLKPRPGEPARFGSNLEGLTEIFLDAGVAWQSDYHEYFTIHVANIELAPLAYSRLTFDGTTGQEGSGGAFLTNPSQCVNTDEEPYRRAFATTLHADSYEEEAPGDEYSALVPNFPPPAFLAGSQEVIGYLPKGAHPEGCANVPFEPTVATEAGTTSTDSPAPATVTVAVPFEPHAAVYQSNVKTVKLSLPQGMGLNPAAAPGLGTCEEGQFPTHTREAISCPADSRLGTVEIESPVLPKGSLKGSVYLAKPEGNDPESGKLYRLFLEGSSAERGVSVRLIAGISADKTTGRLTATIENAPQVPFESFRINLDGKSTSPLTSPSTCGPNVTTHEFGAWSGSPDKGATAPGFNLTGAPSGGDCAKSGAERPFSPAFASAPTTVTAKADTNYVLKVERKDGEQEIKGIDVTLPQGTTARLKGVAYCPESAIAAATASSAKAQIASPSCPDTSFIGTVKIAAGSGANPLQLAGNAYLAGPYKGAPLSMVIVTPALAGPFDLGDVVVHAAVFVEPESGQIHVVSDPIPSTVGGAKVDLRSLRVELSRKFFFRNGTSCKTTSVTGNLSGGGNDPAATSGFTSHGVSAAAWLEGCKALGFKPRLKLSLSGQTKRAGHPHLKAVLSARSGKDADVGSLSVALPHTLFLDQASLGTVCTRVQFAAAQCPTKSIYGHARAWSPLLQEPLEGPVYLRSSSHKLPDLVAHLQGQVTIDLDGRIDSYKGGIRTSFESLPDLPVSKFELNVPGGKRGLLVASQNLCKAPVKAEVKAVAHNSKVAHLNQSIIAAGCKS